MNKLKVSVQTSKWFNEENPAESMKYIKDCGFEGVDYSFNSTFRNSFNEEHLTSFFDKSIEKLRDYYKPHKEAAQKYGITFCQTHGILVIYHKGNPKKTEYCLNVTEKIIEICQYLECKALVIHPWIGAQVGASKEEEIEVNMQIYRRLLPVAKRCGVKICLENLWEKQNEEYVDAPCIDAREACQYIDVLNEEAGEDVFAFCLDVGHTKFYNTDIYEFIKILGKRLLITHLHENDGNSDSHLVPYSQVDPCDGGLCIDWERTLQGLYDIHYEGSLSFETANAIANLPCSMKTYVLEYISKIGHWFKKRLQAPEWVTTTGGLK